MFFLFVRLSVVCPHDTACQAHIASDQTINVDAWWGSPTESGRRKQHAGGAGGEERNNKDMQLLIIEHGGT